MTNNEIRQTKEYKIIRAFGHSDNEAIRDITHGTSVYEAEDWEHNYREYIEEGWGFEDEEEMEEYIAEIKEMIETQIFDEWWDIVEYEGEKFYIAWAR